MDLSNYSVRTDLALEAHNLASPSGQMIPGVHTSSEEHEGIRISITDITSQEGSLAI
ncbi:MAG: endopeptidase, partial [Paenibacillus sp.]|nr:endopeptidase [Paenibacillus sp.]